MYLERYIFLLWNEEDYMEVEEEVLGRGVAPPYRGRRPRKKTGHESSDRPTEGTHFQGGFSEFQQVRRWSSV